MDHMYIATSLERNREVFKALFKDIPNDLIYFKANPNQWCLLEIVCHLYDEEVEDFRTRTFSILSEKNPAPPPIDPKGWVKKRDYISQDFDSTVDRFLSQRKKSVKRLNRLIRSSNEKDWKKSWDHPELGPISANTFLSNWLAHDHLHIKQITRLKYDYLAALTGRKLRYAGRWT